MSWPSGSCQKTQQSFKKTLYLASICISKIIVKLYLIHLTHNRRTICPLP